MEIRGVKLKKITRKPKDGELFILKPPEFFSVPMLADDGDASARVVSVGDSVKEGTLIGKPTGKYGSYVYSPTAGKVIGVVRKLNVSGNECEHVIIKRDLTNGKQTLPIISAEDRTQDGLLKRLYESGLVDNFFPFDPTYKKYLLKNTISKLVINCTEVEPYQTCESSIVETYVSEVVEGARLYQDVSKAQKIVFIFTTKQKYLAKIVRNHIKNMGIKNQVKIKIYPHVYPLNNARLIGYYESGKMVYEGRRTAETSVIVEVPSNCYYFYKAVYQGEPVTERVVSLGGGNCYRKSNFVIKNGTPIGHVLTVVGVKEQMHDNMLVYGGIMSGTAQETLDVSCALTASSILFVNRKEYSKQEETACINCGRCVSVCPVKLHVKNLDEAIVNHDYYAVKCMGVKACINCGACSYVCPAKRYLSQRINFAKDYVSGKKAKSASSSQYELVEGEDMPKQALKIDKIISREEKLVDVVHDENVLPEIDDMLKMLSKAKDKKLGGGKNE